MLILSAYINTWCIWSVTVPYNTKNINTWLTYALAGIRSGGLTSITIEMR